MVVIKFPFFNVQELNLDWIMAMLKRILSFMPIDSGVAGDVLQRGTDGAEWMPISAVSLDIHGLNSASGLDSADEFAIYDNSAQGNYKVTLADILAEVPASAVTSVNGQTGTVVLDASDVSALPDTTTIPTDTSDLTNNAGFVDAAGAAAAAPVQSVNGQTGAVIVSGGGAVDSVNGQTGTVVLGKSDVGLGNVDNVQQYSASNPPPYPVTSVNGQTGAVTVSGSGMVKDLLWTNSSPNTNFPEQTIPLSLSSYKFVAIEIAYSVDSTYCLLFVCTTNRSYNYMTGIDSSGKFERRAINITTTGIEFSAGEVQSSYAGSWSQDNFYSRPYKIYGIK